MQISTVKNRGIVFDIFVDQSLKKYLNSNENIRMDVGYIDGTLFTTPHICTLYLY